MSIPSNWTNRHGDLWVFCYFVARDGCNKEQLLKIARGTNKTFSMPLGDGEVENIVGSAIGTFERRKAGRA